MEKIKDRIISIQNEIISEDKKNRQRPIITEGKSERCSRETTESYRFIFNVNPKVKKLYRDGIDKALESVFKDKYYKPNQFEDNQMAGVYNLENNGRSVINKLNTNYSCFCILLNDINTVLRHTGNPEIRMIGLPPFEQISETKKFVGYIDQFKDKIFSTNSSTFKNLMSVLTTTDAWGEKRENDTVDVLKKKFGNDNVIKVGKLGDKDDALKGIDCVINIDGVKHTSQIKPFTHTNEKDDKIMVFGSANVKKYTTDLLIFTNNKKEILVFDNNDTTILNGNYLFPKSSLIYSLS